MNPQAFEFVLKSRNFLLYHQNNNFFLNDVTRLNSIVYNLIMMVEQEANFTCFTSCTILPIFPETSLVLE